jgi:hypothetical protein
MNIWPIINPVVFATAMAADRHHADGVTFVISLAVVGAMVWGWWRLHVWNEVRKIVKMEMRWRAQHPDPAKVGLQRFRVTGLCADDERETFSVIVSTTKGRDHAEALARHQLSRTMIGRREVMQTERVIARYFHGPRYAYWKYGAWRPYWY